MRSIFKQQLKAETNPNTSLILIIVLAIGAYLLNSFAVNYFHEKKIANLNSAHKVAEIDLKLKHIIYLTQGYIQSADKSTWQEIERTIFDIQLNLEGVLPLERVIDQSVNKLSREFHSYVKDIKALHDLVIRLEEEKRKLRSSGLALSNIVQEKLIDSLTQQDGLALYQGKNGLSPFKSKAKDTAYKILNLHTTQRLIILELLLSSDMDTYVEKREQIATGLANSSMQIQYMSILLGEELVTVEMIKHIDGLIGKLNLHELQIIEIFSNVLALEGRREKATKNLSQISDMLVKQLTDSNARNRKLYSYLSLGILFTILTVMSWLGLLLARQVMRYVNGLRQTQKSLQQSEEQLEIIIESITDGVLVTDQQGAVIRMNPEAVRLTGIEQEKAGVNTLKDILSIEQSGKSFPIDELLEHFRDDHKPIGLVDTVTLISNKEEVTPVVLSGAPIKSAQGKSMGMVFLFKDITVEQKLNKQLRQVEEERQKIEKLETIGTLAGGLAHDFNNILAALYGNIFLAESKLSSEHPAFRYIESATKSIGTATQLTNQLLTFAKGGDPIKTSLSLADLIKETVNFNLSGSNVKPQISEPDDLWLANVDQGQMQQVFGNLTINAKQAMPDGGHLSIIMENAELAEGSALGIEAGKYIRITVTDEGSGIKADYLNRIFEPYFTTKQTGSGLGLATSYSIINRHGGHISVTSELGIGTTFTLYLPATAAQKPSPEKTKITAARQLLPRRILIMDDEKVVRMMLADMLEALSYSVESCADGQQALDLYRQAATDGEAFDLVILDLTIPGGMGGKETAQRILRFDPQAKIVISSGYAEDQLMADHHQYGLAGVIAKPYSLITLEKTLARAFGG